MIRENESKTVAQSAQSGLENYAVCFIENHQETLWSQRNEAKPGVVKAAAGTEPGAEAAMKQENPEG